MTMRFTRFALGALLLFALFEVTGATAGGSARLGPADTTPPKPELRTRVRQDMDSAFRHGIRGTCRTEDNEAPVTCRLVALRKGRQLSSSTKEVRPPSWGRVFDLPIRRPDRRRLRRADPPVMVELRLTVTDPAGNHATVARQVELCKDGNCRTHGGR
jgi:hypothetical protein